MKKDKTLKFVMLISGGLLFLFSVNWAEIVVRQDKRGNLVITNESSRSNKKGSSRKRGGFTYATPAKSSSFKVPYQYQGKIRELSQKHGIKESLIIAVARAESGFNPFAVSKKGAVGIMQLMADTAMLYGVLDRYNAYQNLEGGVKHLKYLYNRFKGNLHLILAAYNAGENAVEKYGGIPPFKETKNFVKRVLRFMGMSTNGLFSSKSNTKIYQYRSKEGKIVITDTYPANPSGPVTVID